MQLTISQARAFGPAEPQGGRITEMLAVTVKDDNRELATLLIDPREDGVLLQLDPCDGVKFASTLPDGERFVAVVQQ